MTRTTLELLRYWSRVPPLVRLPDRISPEVEVKALSINNAGRQSLSGPGQISQASLAEFRAGHRLQEVIFDLARGLTKHYLAQPQCEAPSQVLFPQMVNSVRRYAEEKVSVSEPADIKDLFLAPYYGWLVEILTERIQPDALQGEAPEVPRYKASRGPGWTGEVDFWTSRERSSGTGDVLFAPALRTDCLHPDPHPLLRQGSALSSSSKYLGQIIICWAGAATDITYGERVPCYSKHSSNPLVQDELRSRTIPEQAFGAFSLVVSRTEEPERS